MSTFLSPKLNYEITFAFSCLSFIASLIAVFLLANMYRINQQKFGAREKLIPSLMVATTINSLNNLVSNMHVNILRVLQNGESLKGLACDINGFIGQWTVQADDFSTLAIAIVTFYILGHRSAVQALENVNKHIWVILGAIWSIGIATATAGYFINGFSWTGPWCWFSGDPIPLANYVRYGLTHGPRMIIFVLMIVLYSMMFARFRKRHRKTRKMMEEMDSYSTDIKSSTSTPVVAVGGGSTRAAVFNNNGPVVIRDGNNNNNHKDIESGQGSKSPPLPSTSAQRQHDAASSASASSSSRKKRDKEIEKAINKMILFPVIYIVLWSGGMANRMVQALGGQSDVTTLLQAGTQLIGFADAIVYAYSMGLKKFTRKD